MEMKVLEKEKNMMKIEVTGTDEATLYLLTQQLLSDKNVTVATYSIPHPQLDKPVLYIETNRACPKTALKNAATMLEQQFAGGLELFEKKTGTKTPKSKAKKPAKKATTSKAKAKATKSTTAKPKSTKSKKTTKKK